MKKSLNYNKALLLFLSVFAILTLFLYINKNSSWEDSEYAIVYEKDKDGVWIKTIEDMESYQITYNLTNFFTLLNIEKEDIIEIPILDKQLIKGTQLSCSLRKITFKNLSIIYDQEGNITQVLLSDK